MKHRVTLNSELQHNPFVVPENYFETFIVRKSITLNSGLKQNVFAVPEGYFDILQERITGNIAHAKRQLSVLRWQPLRTQLAFAASFALLISIGYGIFALLGHSTATAEKSYAESFSNYLTQIIDEPVLIQAVANNHPEHKSNKLQPIVVERNDDAIIRYLADADVSLNDIAATY
ncbi:MAG: hypothetical protein LBD87_00325 [Prevotellaceae bacterium]|jgi:hypothetical protein|nr:hypothetical protein [Prevotellaceae bacterium]